MAPKLFRELARSDVIPTAYHPCQFLGSPHRTMAGASARSGRRHREPWLCCRSCAVGVLTSRAGMQVLEGFGDALRGGK